MASARMALWLDETHEATDHPGYFIPNVVTEDEPGYAPLRGNGPFARPWYFGPGIEAAKAQCDDWNAKQGIDRETALEILMSSMRAGRVSR